MAQTLNATVLPKRGHSISDGQNTSITLDVVPSENHVLSSTITDHPVEEGSNVSDHARPDPDVLTLECIISNTPLGQSADPNRAQDAWTMLRDLRARGALVTVLTTLGRYDSMEIQNLSVTRDAPTYNALSFTVTFKNIRVVKNRLTSTTVSRQRNVASKVDTGTQTPEEPTPKEKTDLAKILDSGGVKSFLGVGGG